MLKWKDIRIRPKLLLLFLVTGILPLAIVGSLSYKLARDALLEKSFNQLLTVQDIRKNQVRDLFQERFDDIKVLAGSQNVINITSELNQYNTVNKSSAFGIFRTDTEAYKRVVDKYSSMFSEFVQAYGFDDLYILCEAHGHVMYSVKQGKEFGENLSAGIYMDTGLAHVWNKIKHTRKLAVVDFEPYAPSQDQESLFVGHPVKDRGGVLIGMVVLKLTPEQITRIVDSRKGMGNTGESYLLQHDSKFDTYELRSNLQTMGEGDYVVGFTLDTTLDYWIDASNAGLDGGYGTYQDSAGNNVLVAFNGLDLPGLEWFLISKIDQYEVTEPVRVIAIRTLFTAGVLVILIGLMALLISRGFTHPILEDVRFAREISEGHLAAVLEIDQKDELGYLADALKQMAKNLREMDWMKTGKEGLDDVMRGEHDIDGLARDFITYLVKHLDAQLGAVYLYENDFLVLKASYAFTNRQGNYNRIKLGEGMVGQAAQEDEILYFSNVDDDAPALNYGVGEVIPQHFMIAPLSFEGSLLGAFLIGSMNGFNELERRFVEQNTDNAAILFNAAKSRKTIQELYEKGQQQQEELRVTNEELEEQARALKASEAELQAQQEELRVTNEELEEQTKALQESQAELQAQQEELRVTNEELEEQAKTLEEQKKGMEAQNTDLVEAREQIRKKAHDLELASKYKSEFLANMSHELRTPLNSILILSQLFAGNRDGNLTERQIESASAIHSSGTDLLNLINEILDLSKIEAGKIEVNFETMLLEVMKSDLTRVFKDVAAQKGVEFKIRQEAALPDSIETDSHRLQQILRNLLTNAFKFTEKGAVTFHIKRPKDSEARACRLDPEHAIAFAVIDEGIGIPKDQLEAIFLAFQQADGSTSRKYGGTGLGLSISRELAKLLGGNILLESTEGKGSTFTVVLPQSQAHAPGQDDPVIPVPLDMPVKEADVDLSEPDPPSKEELGPEPDITYPEVKAAKKTEEVISKASRVDDDRKTIKKGEKSLLIIEDDMNFSKIMRDFARERGFKCLVAEDGETGLHFADYYRPSAVILDIGLPGIDGWTVMERLKENVDLRHIPVHFMSAADSSLDAMRMGAIGFLTKPVSMDKIEEAFGKIENLISKPVKKLLVVEDDSIQRESIQKLIGNGDVETSTVATGTEALQMLANEPFDCMILDLGLEDMTGFELLEKIREKQDLSKLPIIVYTGRDLTQDEEKELQRYTESIIVKGAKSPERLLDESALFLHRVEANLPKEQQRMLKMVHDKETVLRDKTVLLVDDDMRNVFALSSVLEEKGIQVIVARDGLESLAKLKEHGDIDLILMDIMMPKMDGYEAMAQIRKDIKHRALPIIALTAKAMKGDRAKCIEAGANDYLAKPVNTDKLISMLRVWLYS